MDMQYSMWERAFMIRKGEQIVTPIISQMNELALPRNSLWHYVPESKIDIGPGSTHPMFKQVTKPIQVYTPLELIDPPNNPHRIAFDSNPLMRGYFMQNRRMRKAASIDKITADEKSLVVVNYALVHNSYKYIRSLYADYNEWADTMYSVMSTMNTLANQSQRNQFLTLGVPMVLPAISLLNKCRTQMDQTGIKIFHSNESRMLLELWKWLDEEKYANIFDRIEEKNYRYINFIIQDTNQWVCVNLMKLHLWKQSTRDKYKAVEAANKEAAKLAKKEGKEAVVEEVLDGFKPVGVAFGGLQLQKYVLHLFMVLAAARSDAGIDTNADLKKAVDAGKKVSNSNVVEANDDDDLEKGTTVLSDGEDETVVVKKGSDLGDSTVSSKNSRNDVKPELPTLRNANEDADSSKFAMDDEIAAMVEADLAQLETISAAELEKPVENDNSVVKPLVVPDTRTYEDKVKDRCVVLAEAGLMTAAEYRRLEKLASKYKTLPNPIGNGLLVDAIKVSDEEVAVDNKNVVAPGAVLVDESMRYSAIEKTQSRYIKETLPKHILGMIMHVQNAEVILDNLEVERREDILGATHNYTVRLIPVEGMPTTLRFPLPEIDPDGTYTSNDVKYSMRNQRGDWPIRKIASNKVALTSYYGKYGVYRSRKSTNDYGQWLVDEIMSLGFDPTFERIFDVNTANVFAKDIKAPRSITSLSKYVREFKVIDSAKDVFTFHLDLTKISENFNPVVVNPIIAKGFTPVAISQRNNIIYFEGDSFYLIDGEKSVPLGELEDILGLDISKIPAEYCELKIAGKYVPVGMILAYDYGLSELIRRLKVQVRRVPVGTRASPTGDEIALVFSDETILFSKRDRMACLLLGGFLEFRRVIRSFSVTDFDSKGVYQNVFDSTGGGTRVIREIKLARDLFVDPITRKVLEDLKQPTDFMGILVYATELLMDDLHRAELDMSEQRIKGYERVAGAVYTEMIRSLRAHNARPGKSRYPIEMKPYAIWTGLAQDASIVVVKDINPITNMKQREEVTFSGTGGRNKDTMTAATREYGPNDNGIISEATKDSGEVGINTYMPPNPLLTNSLGMTVHPDKKEIGMSSVYSSAVLVSPGADRDD